MQIRIYYFININNQLLLIPRVFLSFVVLLFSGFYLWLPKSHTRAWPQILHMHLIKCRENDGILFIRMYISEPLGFFVVENSLSFLLIYGNNSQPTRSLFFPQNVAECL